MESMHWFPSGHLQQAPTPRGNCGVPGGCKRQRPSFQPRNHVVKRVEAAAMHVRLHAGLKHCKSWRSTRGCSCNCGRTTRTTAAKSASQFATACHGTNGERRAGAAEGAVHDVAAAAACDGPTPPPPPHKQMRGDPAMGSASGPPCPRASGTLCPMTSQNFVSIC